MNEGRLRMESPEMVWIEIAKSGNNLSHFIPFLNANRWNQEAFKLSLDSKPGFFMTSLSTLVTCVALDFPCMQFCAKLIANSGLRKRISRWESHVAEFGHVPYFPDVVVALPHRCRVVETSSSPTLTLIVPHGSYHFPARR